MSFRYINVFLLHQLLPYFLKQANEILNQNFRSLERPFLDTRASGKCIPKLKVGFLKTVKCASSSVQNILLRFPLKHNLNIVLPGKMNNSRRSINVKYTVNDWSEDQAEPKFSQHLIKNTAWERINITYHVFLLHTRWHPREISQIMNRYGN